MSYTLNDLVSDLIKNGLPEDYFDPLIPINFGGKQYVADFRDLAILDILRYPDTEADALSCTNITLSNMMSRYVAIPVIRAGKSEVIKVKLKFAREVYMMYSKKCLEYIDVYNMLVEGLLDIFKNTEFSNIDRDKEVDKLYSTSKVGSTINRIKKV
jgi:hypothetical protein